MLRDAESLNEVFHKNLSLVNRREFVSGSANGLILLWPRNGVVTLKMRCCVTPLARFNPRLVRIKRCLISELFWHILYEQVVGSNDLEAQTLGFITRELNVFCKKPFNDRTSTAVLADQGAIQLDHAHRTPSLEFTRGS